MESKIKILCKIQIILVSLSMKTEKSVFTLTINLWNLFAFVHAIK